MGGNSRRRREARQQRGAAAASAGPDPFGLGARRADPGLPDRVADVLVQLFLLQLGAPAGRRDLVARVAEALRLLAAPPLPVARVQTDLVVEAIGNAVVGGWPVADLVQASRRADDVALPWLTAAVERLRRETSLLVRADVDAVAAWAPYDDLERGRPPAVADAVGLLVLLERLPLLDAQAVAERAAPRVSAPSHPKLERVRALLAKAESTEFGPEAEALMVKAQALITKHALGRLLDEPARHDRLRPGVRRIWLDKPYLNAKASVVGVVARANRCRSAFSEPVGFSIVVGEQGDLDAVELLVTSLLLQADTAMFVHGRSGPRGRSRSFRQSFLMAYSTRVGERLGEARDQAVAGSDLLPVLRRREDEVEDAFHAMVATRSARSVRVSDERGWQAGTAAADLSRLDVHDRVEG